MNEEKINKLLQIIACPKTGQDLKYDKKSNKLITKDEKISYEIENDIPILLIENNNKE